MNDIDSYQLAILEEACAAPDGITEDSSPYTMQRSRLAEHGLLDCLEWDNFFGGRFRINDKGREFVKKHSAPAEW